MKLSWFKTDKPLADGWYWIKGLFDEPEIYHVKDGEAWQGIDFFTINKDMYFAGPIEEPIGRTDNNDQTWIHVSEKVPEIDKFVLCYRYKDGFTAVDHLDKDYDEIWFDIWMEIPTTPLDDMVEENQKLGLYDMVDNPLVKK